MKTTLTFGCLAVAALAVVIGGSRNATAGAQGNALVRLQPSTPGSTQVGHSNVSGTAIAGQFVGGGSGLTNLSATSLTGTLLDARLSANVALLGTTQTFTGAKTFSSPASFTATSPFAVTSTTKVTNLNVDLLDGLNSTAFLQAVPTPLVMSASQSGSAVLSSTNSASTNLSSGIFGASSATTGPTTGIYGLAASTSGVGILGEANSASGSTTGIVGRSYSSTGTGVYGSAPSGTGVTRGGLFQSSSDSGIGVMAISYGPKAVWGRSYSASSGYAGLFESDSLNGGGIEGVSLPEDTPGTGVHGISWGTGGKGVYGESYSAAGTSYAVFGRTSNATGFGGYFVGRGYFSGALGIGNPDPGAPLDIVTSAQTASSTSSSNTGGTWENLVNTSANGNTWNLISTGSGNGEGPGHFLLRNANFGFVALAALKTGHVGLGLTNPQYRLDLPNTANNLGRGRANSWDTYSSGRWKENVEVIKNPLETLRQITGVTFDWKVENGGAHDMGFIAEDVGKVLPFLVRWEDDGVNAQGMDYSKLVPLLVESLKEQNARIDRLEAEILRLKSKR